jgi:type 1 glutamine amidotransferase
VVTRPSPDELSIAEAGFVGAAEGLFEVTATQDCGALTRASLAEYDAVVFYTTGELPLADEDRDALIQWVGDGGAFAGVHCATDTLYEYAPYLEMVGGTFDGHPWHEEVTLRVEDPAHPAVAHLGESLVVTDEIYQFRGFRRHPVRVLLSLDPASADLALGKRADGDYANAWTRDWGRGRVFYTALGHRPELWSDPLFLEHLLAGIGWAIGGPDLPAPVPEGAKVLFDGTSLERWTHRGEDGPARWSLVDGAVEVVAGSGDLVTRDRFGDALVHVEFMVPSMPEATGQARGNSGVYVQSRYEVQVLDSFGLEQELGDCASIYGVRVADANACRRPERWQTYDIEFTAPRFDRTGAKTAAARMSVWHNGRPVHRDVAVEGPTAAGFPDEVERAPLLLQDHGNPVRYRNVWLLRRD